MTKINKFIVFTACLFLLFSSTSFAGVKKIMSGEHIKAKFKAEMYYEKKMGGWGYTKYSCRLFIINDSDMPLMLSAKLDKYYLVAKNGKRIEMEIDKEQYPEFINPDEHVRIFFTSSSNKKLMDQLDRAKSFVVELNKERYAVKLVPQYKPLDIPKIQELVK